MVVFFIFKVVMVIFIFWGVAMCRYVNIIGYHINFYSNKLPRFCHANQINLM